MAMIEVRGLSKKFIIPSTRRDTLRAHALNLFRPRPRETLTVLDGVDFRVERGETLGIMGRNGCGKSTLLKIISGIYAPDEGRVVCEEAITPILELGVGWNPELDAIDNVYLLGGIMGLTLSEIGGVLDEVLEFAGLHRFARMPLRHFSSGMSARLAYAVAFRAVRHILVLDEIFAVGDAAFKERCKARFRELQAEGHTIILVSHAYPLIREFCDRGLLLESGRIVAEGTASEVVDAYLELEGCEPGPVKAPPEAMPEDAPLVPA